jgi:hypothetical protein
MVLEALRETVQYGEVIPFPAAVAERVHQRTYQQRLAILHQHAEEIFDAILRATPERYSTEFRRGLTKLLENTGRARNHALDAMYTIVAPVLAEEEARNDREYFLTQVIRRARTSKYSSILKKLEQTAQLTYRRRWNLENRAAAFYTQERHEKYMEIVNQICNF